MIAIACGASQFLVLLRCYDALSRTSITRDYFSQVLSISFCSLSIIADISRSLRRHVSFPLGILVVASAISSHDSFLSSSYFLNRRRLLASCPVLAVSRLNPYLLSIFIYYVILPPQ